MDLFECLEKQDIYFCSICKDIIKLNLQENKKIKEEYNPRNKKTIQLNIPSDEELSKLNFNINNKHTYCFLCLNILNINNDKYSELFKEIKE